VNLRLVAAAGQINGNWPLAFGLGSYDFEQDAGKGEHN